MISAAPQPIMIQSAKFTSNATSIAYLRILKFGLNAHANEQLRQLIRTNSRLCAALNGWDMMLILQIHKV
jgi:hypothetical protein